ncbi:polysaccharide deacetylase family protein [uncultured Bradyrhizobium sp.]|uniref:polysaccharide deacetylase family protein n=1 Tax=uncultured Bradyrhizobium sp. TaxID=199684 RepID=UPI0035CA26F6
MALLALGLLASSTATAADCPGNPAALGTSRTLVVDPREHTRIGTMQYDETLPLQDHEVVLTFDDGPLPPHSNQVLDILASQCVHATFFIIGRMARDFPQGVRRLRDAGHSIGTHSQNHPLSMNRMPIEHARQEIDDGIAATTAALGDGGGLAPFFRIPGLLRAEAVEDYLASKGIQTWSADFPADDWRHIPSSRVYDLAMKRLEAKGKGILLLHDIQARTVAALPLILHDLKARGYRIVHVLPAAPERPKTPTEPLQWQLHPVSETVAISHWPKIPNFAFAVTEMLPAPAVSDSDWRDGRLVALPGSFDRPKRLAPGAVPMPPQAPWPPVSSPQAASATITLPVPAKNVFELQKKPGLTMQHVVVPSARHAERSAAPARNEPDSIAKLISVDAGSSRRMIPGSLPIAEPRFKRVPVTAR